MVRNATHSQFSIGRLESLLRGQRARLSRMLRRRKRLASELRRLDQRIAKTSGKSAEKLSAGISNGRPRRKLPKNAKPLHRYILDILKESKRGMRPRDIRDSVLNAGYKTFSKNFSNVVFLNIIRLKKAKAVTQDKEGRYFSAK